MIAVIFTILLLAHLGDFKATSRQSQSLIGDGQKYELERNDEYLLLTGNNCELIIGTNTALVKITGNGVVLVMKNNTGALEWTGNGGHICMGSATAQEDMEYTGNNGVINIVALDKLSSCMPAETFKHTANFLRADLPVPQALNVRKTDGLPQYKGVGNGNCIKIPHNRVNFDMAGNNNNILVQDKSAPMKYAGNDGHIFMGSESSIQTVNASGNDNLVDIVDVLGSCSP